VKSALLSEQAQTNRIRVEATLAGPILSDVGMPRGKLSEISNLKIMPQMTKERFYHAQLTGDVL